jgi:hypothetical protein
VAHSKDVAVTPCYVSRDLEDHEVESESGLAMSLNPNVSAEINHALPLSHSGALSTKGTLLTEG